MQQLQAVEHAFGLQRIDHRQQLRRAQPEAAAVAARLRPQPADPCRHLDPGADQRLHAESATALEDQRQLGRRLDDEKTAVAELDRPQAEVDEFAVLVAVADEQTAIAQGSEGENELGLAAGFQAVAVGGAEMGDLLDDLRLLIDLDGKDAAVFAAVAGLADGGAEGLVEQGDAGIEEIFDAQQHRHGMAARLDTGDDLHQRNGDLPRGEGNVHRHLAVGGQIEEAGAPLADAVEGGGVVGAPGAGGFRIHGSLHKRKRAG